MAGPNKTYPSIQGLVGLSLHLGNNSAAKKLEDISKKVIVPRGANHYSLVRKKTKWTNCSTLFARFWYFYLSIHFYFFGGLGRGCFLLKEDVRKFMFRWDICIKRWKNLERTYCRTPLWSACVTPWSIANNLYFLCAGNVLRGAWCSICSSKRIKYILVKQDQGRYGNWILAQPEVPSTKQERFNGTGNSRRFQKGRVLLNNSLLYHCQDSCHCTFFLAESLRSLRSVVPKS